MEKRYTEVEEILAQYCEEHCDNLGPELTSKTVKDAVDGADLVAVLEEARKRSRGGASMDLLFVIEMVFKAASFINVCLTIYKELERRFGRKPTEEELTIEAQKAPEAATFKQLEEVVKAVSSQKNL